jgi:exonuclease SbcD
MRRARGRHPEGHRFVAVAHAFVAGGEGSDSELGLAVGGTGEVAARTFQACDYAALGHLHRPQEAGWPHVRYAGSLLKFSASEATHVKSATLVELSGQEPARIECLPLTPRRDLRRLRGHFEDLLKTPQGQLDDYLFLELLDEGPVLDAMARLRQIYPNILGIQPVVTAGPSALVALDFPQRDLDPATLFQAFFQEVQGRPLNDAETAVLQEIAARQQAVEVQP